MQSLVLSRSDVLNSTNVDIAATLAECTALDAAELEAAEMARHNDFMAIHAPDMLDVPDFIETGADVEIDPFGDPTPEELAQIEAYQARVMKEIKSEIGADNRAFRDELRARGVDIVDYCHDMGIALDSPVAEQLAAKAGYTQTTWNDARNVTRRAKEATKRANMSADNARKMAALNAQADTAAATTLKPVPAAPAPKVKTKPAKAEKEKPAGILASAPITTDRAALEAWARNYCHELCEKYQSAKLSKKLYGQFGCGGSLAFQLSVMPDDDGMLSTWAYSAQLSFDKKVGA